MHNKLDPHVLSQHTVQLKIQNVKKGASQYLFTVVNNQQKFGNKKFLK